MVARLSRLLTFPLILVAMLGVYRFLFFPNWGIGDAPREFDWSRNEPWLIEPQQDIPEVATDQQLAKVLDRIKPPRISSGNVDSVNTNNLLHALRLWGTEADFGDPELPSGASMKSYFLDNSQFNRLAGNDLPSLYWVSDQNIWVRAWEEGRDARYTTTSSYHLNDILATLAETGTPLDTPLKLQEGHFKVGDLLNSSMNDFHLRQFESEWSAISYARYAFPVMKWKNTYGEKITVEKIVDNLINAPPLNGPCRGTHRLEALVVLYRADQQAKQLKTAVRTRILRYLKNVSNLLVAGQTAAGYWTARWPEGIGARDDDKASVRERILVTGHHLEWLALAPKEMLATREPIVRAGQWMVRTIDELDEQSLVDTYGPLTHAVRALCLWRSRDPYQIWRSERLFETPSDPTESEGT